MKMKETEANRGPTRMVSFVVAGLDGKFHAVSAAVRLLFSLAIDFYSKVLTFPQDSVSRI
jgi:phage shock protein PspC (stress-responsive transcriptional regulator)